MIPSPNPAVNAVQRRKERLTPLTEHFDALGNPDRVNAEQLPDTCQAALDELSYDDQLRAIAKLPAYRRRSAIALLRARFSHF